MKPKHFDIDIPNNGSDPFINCKLDRKKYGNILTNIINSFDDGFVLALNNEWGTGKTTFIKMWQQQLINKEYKTLYFNAWENDFENDVLVSLLAELEVLKDPKTKAGFKKVLTKATPIMKKASLGLFKGLAKKVGLDEMVQAIIEGTVEASVEGLEKEIESYTNRKKGIQDFRESLEAFIELLSKDKPVVFFIDELDRCRPSYAVEVLERVKHLFSIDGIVFILSIDKTQIEYAVKGVYGSEGINAKEYLRRFIDLEYSLPEPKTENLLNYLYNYFEFDEFYSHSERNKYSDFKYDKTNFLSFTEILLGTNKLTFRQMEKLFVLSRLSLKSYNYNNYTIPRVSIFLIFIKQFKPDLYSDIKNKKLDPQSFIDKIESLFLNQIKNDIKRHNVLSFEVFILNFYLNFLNDSITIPGEKYYLTNHPQAELLIIKSKIDNSLDNREFKNLINIFDSRHHNLSHLKLSYVLKKIDLLDTIN